MSEPNQTGAWYRETGEVFGAKVYADDTMTLVVYPHEATNTPDAGLNLSVETWRAIHAEAVDDSDEELTVEESEHETVTATFDDDQIAITSNYTTDVLRVTTEELENALDHARDRRSAFEYAGLV